MAGVQRAQVRDVVAVAFYPVVLGRRQTTRVRHECVDVQRNPP